MSDYYVTEHGSTVALTGILGSAEADKAAVALSETHPGVTYAVHFTNGHAGRQVATVFRGELTPYVEAAPPLLAAAQAARGATVARQKQAAQLAGQLGLDPAGLYYGAEGAWSNLNPQSVPFETALSVAAAVLQAARGQMNQAAPLAGQSDGEMNL